MEIKNKKITFNCTKNFIKKYYRVSFLYFLVFNFAYYTYAIDTIWQQKLIVKDLAGNYKGWVEVFISTYPINIQNNSYETRNIKFFHSVSLPSSDMDNSYYTLIVSDTDLPFWFFSGKSKTYEYEFYDKDFLPIESYFYLSGANENFEIITKKSSNVYTIVWKSSKGRTKEKTLPAQTNILTAGNLRNIVMSFDLEKKESKKFFLLDKFKLEFKQVTISSSGKKHSINNKDVYRLNIDLNFFGKFSFYIDENYNIVYGEGMGIKVYPER